jgi:flagellar basal-body rod protein FlgF
MLRGIYTSATGMVAEMERQNIAANNLANVNTVGFKRDNVVQTPFADLLLNAYSKNPPRPIGKLGLGVQAVTEYCDFTNGVPMLTGNPTDFAIEGSGLFAVQGNRGIKYTRAGNFVLDKDNYLVNKEGYNVLGQNGPIRLEDNDQITEDGEIMREGVVVDKFLVFDKAGMVKEGESLYTNPSGAKPATDYHVIKGALEQSNVNTIREMVQLITITRNYDTNQKALTAHDETLGRVITDLSR